MRDAFAEKLQEIGITAPVTRFAPSPTGVLHLGHVAHAVYVWGLARAVGARIVLRMEDHDRQRCKPEYEQAILEDLDWLGLAADAPPPESWAGPSPYRQHDNHAIYAAEAAGLAQRGLVYACKCSRKAVLARTAQKGGEVCYDGHCRPSGGEKASLPQDAFSADTGERDYSLRAALPASVWETEDLLLGRVRQEPAAQCGDVVIRDRKGNWSYHFAVVVDDLRHGVNLVIRGADLLESTGRQLALRDLLGSASPTAFAHHGLLTDAAGRKLSKRDFSSGIAELRAAGESPDAVLGLAAKLAGLQSAERPVTANFLAQFFTY